MKAKMIRLLIINYLGELVRYFSESNRGLYATVGAGAAGYIPEMTHETELLDNCFKYGMWSLSIIVGLFTIIGLVQKQIDRYKEKRSEKRAKDFYYDIIDDD